jgi:hypothetical protein
MTVSCAAVIAAWSAAGAGADPFSCTASASVAPLARASGATERTGDLVIVCTGGTPTASSTAIPGYDITVSLNTPATSRLLASPWGEPLLLLDEPPGGTATACASASGICTNTGNGTGADYYVRDGGTNVDAFQGKVKTASSIVFPGVPVDQPGTGATRVLRITNVRADASALAGGDAPTPIVETVSASPVLPVSTPAQTVAFIQSAFTFATLTAQGSAPLAEPVALPACAEARAIPVATLSFKEQFATAFARRNIATTPDMPAALADQSDLKVGTYNSESGYYDHGLVGNALRGDLGLAGLADSGTRLKAIFNGVPAGARVFVDTTSTGGGGTVARLTSTETGAYSPPTGGALGEVAITGGSGSAVWEVLASDATHVDELRFGVYVDVPANAVTPGGTATAGGDLAPTSGGGAPRFAATSTAAPLFSLPACQAAAQPDTTAPVVDSASAAPATFRVDPRGVAESARARKGTTLRYSVSEASTAAFTVRRRSAGRRVGRRCAKPTRANRSRRRCVRYVRTAAFTVASAAGLNQHRFSGRIGKRTLRPGRYRTAIIATDTAGNRSAPRSFGFKIVR